MAEPQASAPESDPLDTGLTEEGIVEPGEEPGSSEQPDVELSDPFDLQVVVQDEESWLEVTIDGAQQVQDLAAPGATYTYESASTAVVQAGNAAQVQVVLDGVGQGVLGDEREVVELRCEVGAGCERELLIAAEG